MPDDLKHIFKLSWKSVSDIRCWLILEHDKKWMNITWYSSIFAIIYVNQQKWKCVSGIRPGTQGEHITGKPKGENEKRKSHSSFQTNLNTHLLCKVCKIYEPMYADEKYQAKKWKHNSDIVRFRYRKSLRPVFSLP